MTGRKERNSHSKGFIRIRNHAKVLAGNLRLDTVFQAVRNTKCVLGPFGGFRFDCDKNGFNRTTGKTLYSSDAPYGEPYLYKQLIEFVSPNQTVAQMALGENILRLLNTMNL